MEESFSHAGVLFFDPEERIYLDHFPGNPVVPGSLIIDAFIRAHGLWGHTGTVVNACDFRFRRFVPPGEYQYGMTKNDNRIRCRLFDNNLVVVTGELVVSLS